MIFSLELEQQFLSGLIKFPESYYDVCNFIDEGDFYSEDSTVNRTIFCIIRNMLQKNEQIDHAVVAERVQSLGITFEEGVSIGDYLKALSLRKVSEKAVSTIAKDLKKITVRRNIAESGAKLAQTMKKISSDVPYEDIIKKSDAIYNEKVNLYEIGTSGPTSLYSDLEEFIEARGENPSYEFGFLGPYQSINKIYGSLLRGGNITVIVSRAGVGKTTLALDYCTKVAEKYNVPVLHFDNGEMSKRELQIRQVAAVSGVPIHLIESGFWRKAGDDVVKRVRDSYKIIEKQNFYYENVAGKKPEEMVEIIKRFYYSKVGRGNKMVFSFDYIKSTNSNSNVSEWILIGDMVQKFKDVITKDIVFEDEPMISMFTSVQSNRSGIVTNKKADQVNDDEGIVAGSDRIIHFASHMFILRKKTNDELANHGLEFGTHKMICIKARHLGEEWHKHINPIKLKDGSLVNNYINLDIKGFAIKDCGDLNDLIYMKSIQNNLQRDNVDDDDMP